MIFTLKSLILIIFVKKNRLAAGPLSGITLSGEHASGGRLCRGETAPKILEKFRNFKKIKKPRLLPIYTKTSPPNRSVSLVEILRQTSWHAMQDDGVTRRRKHSQSPRFKIGKVGDLTISRACPWRDLRGRENRCRFGELITLQSTPNSLVHNHSESVGKECEPLVSGDEDDGVPLFCLCRFEFVL